ncbi:PTS transporter subunit EIIC [Dolosigranulum pigrum]|jgi:PTS system protein
MGKYDQTIQQVLDVVGGQDNIKTFEHCATRLRIILKDDSVVDKEKAEEIEYVKGYFFNTGQHQFIFGTGTVNDVYAALKAEIGGGDEESSHYKDEVYANMSPTQKIVRTLADILVPLIPALVTTGLLMGVRGTITQFGVEFTPEVATFIGVLTDTAFAFLPVLIAYSATKKFGGTPLLGILVGLMLVNPALPNAWAVAGGDAEPLNVFGIDLIGYQGTIFPAIIVGWLLSKLEKWLRTFVPKVIDLLVTPFVAVTVTMAVVMLGVGPFIQLFEDYVINGIIWLINAPFGIGYAVFGGLQQLIVITGLHHSISIIEIGLLNDVGYNVIQPLATASMAGQFGAALGVAFLVKNKVKRTNMLATTSSTLFGITEPLLFGINIRSLRILGSGIAAGAVGGVLVKLFNLQATGMGITFLPGGLLYEGLVQIGLYYLMVLLTMAAGFIFVWAQRQSIKETL